MTTVEKEMMLSEMVGDYSQHILDCSYNDEDVLEDLISGEMEKNIQSAEPYRIENLTVAQPDIKPADYHKVMLSLVKELKGWADGWLVVTPLQDLDPNYQDIMERHGFKLED